MERDKLVVLGTGGTIAGRSFSNVGNVDYRSGDLGVKDLIGNLPGHLCGGGLQIEALDVAQVDSKDMDAEVWGRLIVAIQQAMEDPRTCAVVVTHGTDTIEETAFLLDRVLLTTVPVVLTCAMRPANASFPDGPQNLLDACSVALHPETQGVVVVAAGLVHASAHVQKNHPYRISAFTSGERGPLGCVEEGRVRWFHPCPHRVSGSQASIGLFGRNVGGVPADLWPRVDLLVSHAGAVSATVEALVGYTDPNSPPLRGLVVAGTGNGTIHQSWLPALQRVRQSGVVVWRSSRCSAGQIVLPITTADEPALELQSGSMSASDPTLPSTSLSPVKARIALMLALMVRDRGFMTV